MFDINDKKSALNRIEKFKTLLSEYLDKNPVLEKEIIFLLNEFMALIHYKIKNDDFEFGLFFKPEEEEDEIINLLERSDIIFQQCLSKLTSEVSLSGLFQLISLSNDFIQDEYVPIKHKINLIDVENNKLKDKISVFLEAEGANESFRFIESRFNLISDLIFNYKEVVVNNKDFNQDPLVLNRGYNIYLNYYSNYFIQQNQIFQLLSFLKQQLEKFESSEVHKILINKLIEINSSFLIEPKEYYEELIEEHSGLFEKEELEFLSMQLNSNPKGIEMLRVQYTQGKLLSKSVANKEIISLIRFTIPFAVTNFKNGAFMIGNNRVEFSEVKNVFKDPIFQLFRNMSIGGMNWSFFSDGWHSEDEKLTTINFMIPEFYHPDFNFKENQIEELDFEEKKALMGRDYFPQKEMIVKTLLDNYDHLSKWISIPKDKIDINIFSNFLVDYYNIKKQGIEYRRLYALTNPGSYSSISNRFIERLNELNLSDAYISITELANKTELVSDKSLYNFLKSLIKIVVKNNIELHSNYKYFWKKNSQDKLVPQTEPEMQPLILSQLKVLCDYMGIQISREVETGNGKVDFVCSASFQGKLIKTCIELKNAHKDNLESGLTRQLPEYLKSERTKYGIYLILWYKGDYFDFPRKYSSEMELEESLQTIKPIEFKTDSIIINCNKPKAPSKLK